MCFRALSGFLLCSSSYIVMSSDVLSSILMLASTSEDVSWGEQENLTEAAKPAYEESFFFLLCCCGTVAKHQKKKIAKVFFIVFHPSPCGWEPAVIYVN